MLNYELKKENNGKRNFAELTVKEASEIAVNCYKVLFSRFKLTHDKIEVLTLTKDGISRESKEIVITMTNNAVYNQQGNIV